MNDITAREREVATTILAQLGGNRFRAMTGAKDFIVIGETALRFSIPVSKGINRVEIKLNGRDLYDVEFQFHRAGKVFGRGLHGNVYAEDLQRLFTQETGLYTHL